MHSNARLGTIACQCVINAEKPVLAVSHAGGDWQMYCSWDAHDFNAPEVVQSLGLIAIAHLLERDPGLREVLDMPVDVGAERAAVGEAWAYFDDCDAD